MIFVVSPGQPIQPAVDGASPGDTILVRPGTYNENIDIPPGKDRLRIVGSGAGKTILDGTGLAGESGFSATATHFVTIIGFTVQNFAASGLRLSDSNDWMIRDNAFVRNGLHGILLLSSDRTLVKGNTVDDNSVHGIMSDPGSDRTYIIGNKVRANDQLGLLIQGANVLVYQNTIESNVLHGIELESNGHWIIENTIRLNAERGISSTGGSSNHFVAYNKANENGDDGINFLGGDGRGHIIIGNTCSHHPSHGISVSHPEVLLYNNTMERNTSTNFNGAGGFEYSLVLGNVSRKSSDEGIDPVGSFNRVLFNRTEDNDSSGIAIHNDANLVDNNRVEDNNGSGIVVGSSAVDNAIRSNKLDDNEPFDILVEPPATTTNTFDQNKCESSSPPGLCG